ncbi:hypothetical protein ACIA5C_47780 [Actinoplanes sp. NPDC051343]|uniref:hypothetical protein n=1 Tax=Actinoplanes sp. NPDC051343 TaxID=3363906 RepID=UPI0037B5A745
MLRLALYFPFIHVRDDAWLKMALYWPSICRLVPDGYPVRDSPTSQAFKDAGVLKDEIPGSLVHHASADLAKGLSENSHHLMTDFSLERARRDFDGRRFGDSGPEEPALGWIHRSKFPQRTLDILSDMGLATRGRGALHESLGSGDPDDWIGMHPALAGAYMSSLAKQVSDRLGLDPLTDQADLRCMTADRDVESALRLLSNSADVEQRTFREGSTSYVLMALKFVRLRNIDAIPIENDRQVPRKLIE